MEKILKKELISIAEKMNITIAHDDKKNDIIEKIKKKHIQNLKKIRNSNYGSSILPYESGIGGAYSQPSFGFGHKK